MARGMAQRPWSPTQMCLDTLKILYAILCSDYTARRTLGLWRSQKREHTSYLEHQFVHHLPRRSSDAPVCHEP
jgi:hypothetical protein